MIPGELFAEPGELEFNAGRHDDHAGRGQHRRPPDPGRFALSLPSKPTKRLSFDRDAARGFRLDIAAGTAVRFEPGQTRTVQLVALAGERKVYGFRGLIQGSADEHEDKPSGLCRNVRPDHRRPPAPGRHRTDHRGREGLHDLRRGSEIRRRQGHPRRHGPEPARFGRNGRYRDHQRPDRRCRHRHHQGRHRPEGRPHRRHRQGRQPGHPARRDDRHRPGHRGHRRRRA